MELRLLALYPEQMNIYADRGNIIYTCSGAVSGAASVSPTRPPARASPWMRPPMTSSTSAEARTATSARWPPTSSRPSATILHPPPQEAVILAVCGGYQLLGHSYQLGSEKLPGLGLVDLETIREPGPRLIGNAAIEADFGDGARLIAGFENHGGRTYLGSGTEALGRVIKGFGNNGVDGLEGSTPPT